jgi:K+-sensing histidine kinase KdpD
MCKQWPAWSRYVGALALSLAVAAARVALNPVWGRQHNRHLVFLPTVMAAAWLFGFGPGLLATGASAVILSLLWTPGPLTFVADVEILLFFLMGVAVCALIESLDRAPTRRRGRDGA